MKYWWLWHGFASAGGLCQSRSAHKLPRVYIYFIILGVRMFLRVDEYALRLWRISSISCLNICVFLSVSVSSLSLCLYCFCLCVSVAVTVVQVSVSSLSLSLFLSVCFSLSVCLSPCLSLSLSPSLLSWARSERKRKRRLTQINQVYLLICYKYKKERYCS